MVKVSADIIIFAYWNFDIIIIDKFSKNSLQKIKQFYPEKIYCKWEQYIIDIVKKRKNDNIW